MTLKYLTVVRIVPPARVAICIVLVFFGRGGGEIPEFAITF